MLQFNRDASPPPPHHHPLSVIVLLKPQGHFTVLSVISRDVSIGCCVSSISQQIFRRRFPLQLFPRKNGS